LLVCGAAIITLRLFCGVNSPFKVQPVALKKSLERNFANIKLRNETELTLISDKAILIPCYCQLTVRTFFL